jgi:phosphoglycolate phosphatase
MTDVPVDDPETLRHILANTEALLLDFDGPICSVFAGYPAHTIADQLREIITEGGYRDLPSEVATSEDPFDVLKYAATLGDDEAYFVEAALCAYEVDAIVTAAPTPGAFGLIHAWKESGRTLAIVSNNSAAAISIFVTQHKLDCDIEYIAARTSSDVQLLKPNPHLITQAISSLATTSKFTTIVGDSISDIEAANMAQIHSIGYANKPQKAGKLDAAGADLVVSSMFTIRDAL